MIEKIVLLKVYVSDKSKDGIPFISKKTGKPFKKIAIQAAKYGDKWLSGFINSPDDLKNGWRIGDEVQVVVERNGEWLNFSTPTNFDVLKEKHYLLEDRVKILEKLVFVSHGSLKQCAEPQEKEEKSKEQEDIDSIPF